MSTSNQRVNSMASSGIPYETEQGISKRVSGKIFQGTGNLQRPLCYLGSQRLCRRCQADGLEGAHAAAEFAPSAIAFWGIDQSLTPRRSASATRCAFLR